MRSVLATVVALGLFLGSSASPNAHHSILGQFDASRTVTLTGTIAKVDWINPHPYIYLTVADARGMSTTWALSTAPIAMLRKAGITREALRGTPGDRVTVTGHPALNEKPLAWMTKITYPDGRFFSLGE